MIADVFANVAKGSTLRLKTVMEDLAARTDHLEDTSAHRHPTAVFVDAAPADEKATLDECINFVGRTMQSQARHVSVAEYQSVQYVSSAEYLGLMARCAAGVPDEKRVTRYWAGISRFNPKTSLMLIVAGVLILIIACVIGFIDALLVAAVQDVAVQSVQQETSLFVASATALTANTGLDAAAAMLPGMKAVNAIAAATVRQMTPQPGVARPAGATVVAALAKGAQHADASALRNTRTAVHMMLSVAADAVDNGHLAATEQRTALRDWVAHAPNQRAFAVLDTQNGTVLAASPNAGCGATGYCSALWSGDLAQAAIALGSAAGLHVAPGANLTTWMACTRDPSGALLTCVAQAPPPHAAVAFPHGAAAGHELLMCDTAAFDAGVWRSVATGSSLSVPMISALPLGVATAVERSIGLRVQLPFVGGEFAAWCRHGSPHTKMQTSLARGMATLPTAELVDPSSNPPIPRSFTGDPRDNPQYWLSIVTDGAVLRATSLTGSPVFAAAASVRALDRGVVAEVPSGSEHLADTRRHFAKSIEQMHLSLPDFRAVYLVTDANGTLEVTPPLPATARGLQRQLERAFLLRAHVSEDVDGVFVSARFVAELNAVVGATFSKTRSTSAVRNAVLFAIAAGVGLSMLMFVLLRVLGLVVLDSIEVDYDTYKAQVEQEKTQFSDLVRDTMPGVVAERFYTGETLISDYHPQLTFFFSDVVSFTERSKSMNNVDLVRFLGYTFMLLDAVAEFYDIHKVKSIGDAFFAVSGLDDAGKRRAGGKDAATLATDDPKQHQTFRMMCFGVVSQMLLSPNFSHYPERTQCFADVAGGHREQRIRLAPCRMGMHVGPAYAGVFDAGRAPQFDCIGAAVGVCSLLEAAAAPGTIRISEPLYRQLMQVDANKDFVCSPPQRTLAKNQGRITSYSVVASFLAVPQQLLELLRIDRALRTRTFTTGGFRLSEVVKKHDFGKQEISEFNDESDDTAESGDDDDDDAMSAVGSD